MSSLMNSPLEAMRVLVSSSVRGGLLLTLVALAAALVPARRASLRHFLWALGLGQLVLLTALVPFVPAWHTHALPAAPFTALSFSDAPLAAHATEAIAPVMHAAPPAAASPAVVISWPGVALTLWVLGTAVLLLRRLVSWGAARALVRSTSVTDDPRLCACLEAEARRLEIDHLPALRLSARIGVPLTAGIRNPALLLPAEALTWNDDLLRSVMAHELAHVRRRDLAVQMAADLVRALHWPNPLAWLAHARLLVERERSADDCVISGGARRSDYAGHLLALADTGGRARAFAAGASMIGRSQLRQRLERLLARPVAGAPDGGPGLLRRRTAIALALVAGAAALPMACLEGTNAPTGPALELTYKVAPERSRDTAAVLSRRLQGLGLDDARVISEPGTLTVDIPALPRARQGEVKSVLAASARLRTVLVTADSDYSRALADYARRTASVTAAGITVDESSWKRDDGQSFHDTFLTGPREALASFVAHLPAALRPPAGHTLMIDKLGDGDRYRTLELDDGQSLQITHVINARVFPPTMAGDMYQVNIELDAADGAQLQKLTSAHLGHRLALIFDEDDLWGAPMVQSTIGTHVSVTSRGSQAEAEQLAAGFRAGGLPARLELIREDIRSPR